VYIEGLEKPSEQLHKNQQQAQPMNSTRLELNPDHITGDDHSHHCTNPTPQKLTDK